MKFGTDALARIYKRTELFFCNVEEAQRILKLETRHLPTLMEGLRKLGPKLPVVTDGPDGAYTYMSGTGTDGGRADGGENSAGNSGENNSEKVVHLSAYPDEKPAYERTGAGDAFASTFSIAFALGGDVETALKWGSINSMSVCQHVGAQKGLLTREKIAEYLAKQPEGWKAVEVK